MNLLIEITISVNIVDLKATVINIKLTLIGIIDHSLSYSLSDSWSSIMCVETNV